MRHLNRFGRVAVVSMIATALLWPQVVPPITREPEERRLPSGRSQKEAILEAEFKKTLEDVSRLVELAEELKADLEKHDRYVLSIPALKKTEEIEKLAKRIRSRLRR